MIDFIKKLVLCCLVLQVASAMAEYPLQVGGALRFLDKTLLIVDITNHQVSLANPDNNELVGALNLTVLGYYVETHSGSYIAPANSPYRLLPITEYKKRPADTMILPEVGDLFITEVNIVNHPGAGTGFERELQVTEITGFDHENGAIMQCKDEVAAGNCYDDATVLVLRNGALFIPRQARKYFATVSYDPPDLVTAFTLNRVTMEGVIVEIGGRVRLDEVSKSVYAEITSLSARGLATIEYHQGFNGSPFARGIAKIDTTSLLERIEQDATMYQSPAQVHFGTEDLRRERYLEQCTDSYVRNAKLKRIPLPDFKIYKLSQALCDNSEVANVVLSLRPDIDTSTVASEFRPMQMLIHDFKRGEIPSVVKFFENALYSDPYSRQNYKTVNINRKPDVAALRTINPKMLVIDIDQWIKDKTPQLEGALLEWRDVIQAQKDKLMTVIAFGKYSAEDYQAQGLKEEAEFLDSFASVPLANRLNPCQSAIVH